MSHLKVNGNNNRQPKILSPYQHTEFRTTLQGQKNKNILTVQYLCCFRITSKTILKDTV